MVVLVIEIVGVVDVLLVEWLRDGFYVVIVGLFNVGKLMLINLLGECDVVIVLLILGIM